MIKNADLDRVEKAQRLWLEFLKSPGRDFGDATRMWQQLEQVRASCLRLVYTDGGPPLPSRGSAAMEAWAAIIADGGDLSYGQLMDFLDIVIEDHYAHKEAQECD